MNALGNIFYVSALIWYGWHLVHRLQGIYATGFVGGYLADLLVLPIVCTTIQWVLNLRQPPLALTALHVLIIALIFSVFCEGILPAINPSVYTRDVWDVMCYITGGFAYLIWIKAKLHAKRLNKL